MNATHIDTASAVEMVNTHEECEVVRALNKHEAEAIPLQRIRGGQYAASPFGRRHLPMRGRDKLDIGGVRDSVPHNVAGIRVLEPAAVGVVATKVRVDDVRHGTDIALPGYVPGGNE